MIYFSRFMVGALGMAVCWMLFEYGRMVYKFARRHPRQALQTVGLLILCYTIGYVIVRWLGEF